ncbi:MAG: hypothetical protein BGO42_03170 [Flavobacterium sp. 40-81]|nr:MAG: hypothetical protein BGO42_03170 [Flavobacterium sp. 40-81]
MHHPADTAYTKIPKSNKELMLSAFLINCFLSVKYSSTLITGLISNWEQNTIKIILLAGFIWLKLPFKMPLKLVVSPHVLQLDPISE